MILIIAEKPSLGRNIVDAVNGIGSGSMQRRQGYFEGCGYIVTWAFGHLFSLSDIEYYTEGEGYKPDKKPRWTLDNLPCFPKKFNFSLKLGDNGKPDTGIEAQFAVIRSLCNRPDVDTIVNAGDADREGEIIVRLCISNALQTEKAQKRLWLPDQTPDTIRAGLQSMKDEKEYDLLAYEGYARTFIDWLYGTNLTRYATVKSGAFLRVGRVIIPIVKAIYDRDMQIKNFVPEPYFAIISKTGNEGEEIELVSKLRFAKDEKPKAEQLCADYNAMDAVVTQVKKKKAKLPPGKLYSLTKLQNILSKKYKMPMNESLAIAQKLYEQGYLTYPRTNSEYLATAEKGKIKQILGNVVKLGYPVKFRDDKSIFDDSKIESHSALTPTYKIPAKNALSEKEQQVYSTVFRRFVAVFCAEECTVNRTEITVTLGENVEEFVLKGTVILEKGWTAYDDSTQKDKILPDLKKGDLVAHDFQPLERTTTPPRHYTVETLNNYLKNPFREEKAQAQESESDDEDYRAIFEGLELGTEATRTGIIDNALHSGYISLNKDVYTIQSKGIYLIETLKLLGISMDKYKTSELGQALKKVYKGEIPITESLRLAQNEIAEIFAKGASGNPAYDIGVAGEEVGSCPKCGNPVTRGQYGYGCSGYKEGCKFRIPLSLCGRCIPINEAKNLLAVNRTRKLDGFISKSGKPFSASLKMDEEHKVIFVF